MKNRGTRPYKVAIALKLNSATGRRKLSGILRYLASGRHWDIRLLQSEDEVTREVARTAKGERADGFIIGSIESSELLSALDRTTTPVVFIDLPRRFTPRNPRTAFVVNDNEGIGVQAARHFVSLGRFSSYAFLPTDSPTDWSTEREASFRAELARHQRTCITFKPAGTDTSLGELAAWVAGLPKPAAVLTAFDLRAQQLIEACHDAGLLIPQQLIILGVDDDDLICDFTNPSLSSIRAGSENGGALAAAALETLLSDRKCRKPVIRYGSAEVVERESTRIIAPSGHLIRRALAFIRTNYATPITASSVAKHLGVSRRLADLRFRELHSSTISETIANVRLEALKRLLLVSKQPIGKLTRACGFQSASWAKQLFRRRTGLSMRDWRRQNGYTGNRA